MAVIRKNAFKREFGIGSPYIHHKSEGKSEGTTKARRRQGVSMFDIVIPKKPKIRVPLFQKKSGPSAKWVGDVTS